MLYFANLDIGQFSCTLLNPYTTIQNTGPNALVLRLSCRLHAKKWTNWAGILAMSSSSRAMLMSITLLSVWRSLAAYLKRKGFALALSANPIGAIKTTLCNWARLTYFLVWLRATWIR